MGEFKFVPAYFAYLVSSFGLSSVLRPFLSGGLIASVCLTASRCAASCTVSSVWPAVSKITSLAFLSVRMPWNEGCLKTPSLVTSAKATSQTSSGLSQVCLRLWRVWPKARGLVYIRLNVKRAFVDQQRFKLRHHFLLHLI